MTFVAALIAVYGIFVFSPFNWQAWPKQTFTNGVVRTAESGLHFQSAGIAHTKHAPEWLESIGDSSTIRVLLEVRSDLREQTGPARMFTISSDPYLRNLTVSQDGVDLSVRLRRYSSDLNGMPDFVVEDVFGIPGWHHIEIKIEPMSITIRIDEKDTRKFDLQDIILPAWSPHHRLALGNELTGNRAWVGGIRKATVEVDRKHYNYLAPDTLYIPPDVVIPDDYMKIPKYQLVPFSRSEIPASIVRDWVLNLVGFVPLGFFLMSVHSSRQSVFIVTTVCTSMSFTIEISQLFLPSRTSSVDDLVLNTIGGMIGAWLFKYFFDYRSKGPPVI